MQEKLREQTSQSKKRNRQTTFTPYALVVIAILVCVFLFFRYTINSNGIEDYVAADAKETLTPNALTSLEKTSDTQQRYHIDTGDTEVETPSSRPGSDDLTDPREKGLLSEKNDPTVTPSETQQTFHQNNLLDSKHQYKRALDNISSFYTHLDQQPYMVTFQLKTSSDIYFSTLIQKILDSPPLVSGETDDLFNILQNTAHFFRIVGRNNILLLKSIYSHEKNSIEDILLDFYTVSRQPQHLTPRFAINVEEGALYDYAGFFLTTMGGRLYLFRQDSMLRMLVSYYSILIVDEANRSGNNRHGIDIASTLNNTIAEIEQSGAMFRLKELYLDNLYKIKERNL